MPLWSPVEFLFQVMNLKKIAVGEDVCPIANNSSRKWMNFNETFRDINSSVVNVIGVDHACVCLFAFFLRGGGV